MLRRCYRRSMNQDQSLLRTKISSLLNTIIIIITTTTIIADVTTTITTIITTDHRDYSRRVDRTKKGSALALPFLYARS